MEFLPLIWFQETMRWKVCHDPSTLNIIFCCYTVIISVLDSEYYDRVNIPHPYLRAEAVFVHEQSQVWFKNLDKLIKLCVFFMIISFTACGV